MQIYLARNNQQAGPYTLEQLNQMLASQQVLLTDLIWHQGMKEWKTVGEVTQGQFSYQPTTINTTQQTTSSNDTLATTNTTSNSTIISHHQPYQEPVQKQNSSAELAGRGKRMIAKFVDLLLLSLPQIIVTALYFPIDAVTRLANEATTANATEQQMQILEQFSNSIPSWLNIALLVYTLFLLFIQHELIRQTGQSIGKKLFKLQIVDAENNQMVSSWRAFFLRSFVFLLLSQLLMLFPLLMIVFVIDFIMLFTSPKRTTLHDRLARTKVILYRKK